MPNVSIIILIWNNQKTLLHCIDRLAEQSYQDFEIILVSNGLKDKPLQNRETYGLPIQVEMLKENLGFAVANNIGAQLAHGKWLILLNADAYPEPDWLENLMRAAEENPQYALFSSRQLQANDTSRLDGAGDVYHITGLAWRRFYNLSSEQFGHQIEEVFSACAAAALIAREEFLAMGGFDENYFSYFEDVDLGFRLRLRGKRCLYVPDAVVHHVGSASTGKRSDFSVYYGYRNLIWTFFKNMPSPLLWFLLPLHIGTMLFFVIYLSLRGQAKTILRALWDAMRGLPNVLAKRKIIQQSRKISSFELLRVISISLVDPWVEFMKRNQRK